MAVESDIEKSASPMPASKRAFNNESCSPSTSDLEAEQPIIENEFEPPDGGWRAWSQVLAACLLNMLAWGYPTAFGVYQLYYRDTLKLPESQVSWIGSCQTFLDFALCIISGRLADAGYIRSTISAGALLVVFGTFMTSLCTKYWQIFLAQGVVTGVGLGLLFMPPLSVVNSYFRTKKSMAMAIAATGTGFGSVIFPTTIQYLIPQVGFPWAVRCAAFVALTISILALLLIRPVLKPRTSGPMVEWEAFRELPYLLYTLGAFLFFWVLYFGSFYINAFARNVIHFSTTDSVQLLLITNGMSVVARPYVGFMADRYLGPINTYGLHMFIFGSMLFAWLGVHSRTGLYVFAVFFGFATGAAQGVFGGSLASLTKDPRKMGTRFGMVCTLCAFSSLAGPPTAGAIIDRSHGEFTYALIWAALVIILASLITAGARIAVSGFRLRVKL